MSFNELDRPKRFELAESLGRTWELDEFPVTPRSGRFSAVCSVSEAVCAQTSFCGRLRLKRALWPTKGLSASIALAARSFVAVQEPKAYRDAGRVVKLRRQRDDAVHDVGRISPSLILSSPLVIVVSDPFAMTNPARPLGAR